MGAKMTGKNEKRLKEVGIIISACRKARELSQERLAAEAEISRSLISAIEAPGFGISLPALDVLCSIADALGVEAKDLLGGEWPAVLVK